MALVRATYVMTNTFVTDDSDPAVSNLNSLRAKAQAALASNATFQAIGSPTTAQVTAQVQLLTKECNAIIRLLINQLDSVTGT